MEKALTSEEVTSPDPSDGGVQKNDCVDGLSPLSSQYSSCGESEFDRYCSANSVMGTPSVCSSMGVINDFVDSDFGSLKNLESFNLGGGRIPRKFEENTHSTKLARDNSFDDCLNDAFSGLNDEVEDLCPVSDLEGTMRVIDNVGSSSSGHGVIPMSGSKAACKGVKLFDGEVGKKEDLAFLLKNVENVLLQGAVAARSAADNLLDSSHADEMEDERCQEVDDGSSRYEHSDGEDSMFNYGSDDGSQPNAYYVRNVNDKCVREAGNGISMLMNPTVAFGSEDWEDFEFDGKEEKRGMQIPDSIWERQLPYDESQINPQDFSLMGSASKENFQRHVEEKKEKDFTLVVDDLTGEDTSFGNHQKLSSDHLGSLKLMGAGSAAEIGSTSGMSCQVAKNDGLDEYLESCTVRNIFEDKCSSIYVQMGTHSMLCDQDRRSQGISNNNGSGRDDQSVLRKQLDLPPNFGIGEASLPQVDHDRRESSAGHVSIPISLQLKSDKERSSGDLNCVDQFTTSKGKDLEMDSFDDELVHEMEEILLDSCDSRALTSKQRYTVFHSEQSSPRDGGSTASTSGLDDGYPSIQHPLKIDEIEVVGAKQRNGDVSFSERLVGVREYTVYVLRVSSGKDQWEVERRYRDFDTLYRRLKTYFAAQQWVLPPPWSSVERESRKFFGNASPDVVAERSTLIQECLSSILQFRYLSSPPSALIWFLAPPPAILSSSQSNAVLGQSTTSANTGNISTLGKTISLIVDLRSPKSVKELLDKQHYECAGCHKHFANGKNRMQELALSFGWGKPRFCEYTGQLFCSSCHMNDTAVLPARVLHHWDFTPYPVSQLAKSYLDSIIDKPMLCVSAANPFLFSKVATLHHIVGIRRKVGAMLPYIRCSFRRSVYRRLGYRTYLLETNDFFALRDLIDLSKGAFAALPSIIEAVLKKIEEHITELCLECCDNGLPCGARQACDNPSSLIFPFQEDEIRRCKSCNSVFHKYCFDKLADCPCGVVLREADANNKSLTKLRLGSARGAAGSASSPVEFISSLFSTSRSEKLKGQKEGDNVILMGALPSTSL